MRPSPAHRSQNLDLLRLIAAFAVLWSHQHAFSAKVESPIPFLGFASPLALFTFFAISGYLNAKSLFASRSAFAFLAARALRIFPALTVCVAFCILVGAVFTSLPLEDYLLGGEYGFTGRNSPLSFLLRNSTLLFGIDYNLPSVFENSTYPKTINGSLWTLPYEAKLYLYLAAAGTILFFRERPLGWCLFAAITGWALYLYIRGTSPPLGHGAIFAAVFASGVCLALLNSVVGQKYALALFAIPFVILLAGPNAEAAMWVACAPCCMILAKIPLPTWIGPRIDISYGVYLYAFPVQQVVSLLGVPFTASLVMSAVATTVLAIASALLIERPALALKRRKGRSLPDASTITVSP
jgi:peptidoglycan/LPS O-acetylase OafA/YrhL